VTKSLEIINHFKKAEKSQKAKKNYTKIEKVPQKSMLKGM